jgi:hypothetical protein
MKSFCATLALLSLVSGWSVAVTEDPLRVYYVKGEPIEQITNDGVTVMISHFDTGKLNRIVICAINNSPEAVNVIPAQILLRETAPKNEQLRIKSEHDLQKMVDHRVFWGQMVTAIGAGLSRSQSTIVTHSTYGSSVTTVNTPDYLAQARWMAAGDELAMIGRVAKDKIDQVYLKKTTVFPGDQFTGVIWFSRQKGFESGIVSITVGSRNYDFPFPPPESAKAPVAPGVPTGVARSARPVSPVINETQTVATRHQDGTFPVLGVSVETFEQGGAEIVEIDPDGAASLAGFHVGDVINRIGGKRVSDAPALTAAMANFAPASVVKIGYMFHNPSFGWMQGTEKLVTLNRQ